MEKTRWCRECGYKKDDVDLRRWECPECGTPNILGDRKPPTDKKSKGDEDK